MGKWVLLGLAAASCITVWIFVVWNLFIVEPKQIAKQEIAKQEVNTSSEEISITEPTLEIIPTSDREEVTLSFKDIGLRKEDAFQIAPNGEISIDELLTIIHDQGQRY